ncbi:hypothetical protein [Krasilnikovia sp. MM14-A1004]|uniref:hypothetical protein n=1 Tax=Krasilnikovia sp. MM14-A1004 TaxID=3373541 RepID=UPI00399CF286
MALTGLVLLACALLASLAVAAATVRFWSLPGRWRLPARVAGVLLTEALLVATAGLVLNRHEEFYPSWAALLGDTGTRASATVRAAGRLDGLFSRTGAAAPSWRPAGWAAWRLAAAPLLVVPPGYRARRSVAYPALLELVAPGGTAAAMRAAAANPDAVRVVLVPTGRTAAAALAALPGLLAADLRVTARGWAVVAVAARAGLAAHLVRDDARFSALAVVGPAAAAPTAPRAGAGLTALSAPGAPIGSTGSSGPCAAAEPGAGAGAAAGTRAGVEASAGQGAGGEVGAGAESVASGVAVRCFGAGGATAVAAGSAGRVWAAADAWAVGQTPAPLAAPAVLPR